MLKIKKSSEILCVLEKNYTVSLVEEIPENRVCFAMRTLTNLEVAEVGLKMDRWNVQKILDTIENLDVNSTTQEEIEKLYEDVLLYGNKLKAISKEYFPKFLKKIHNAPEGFDIESLNIFYIDQLFNKCFYESCELSEDDALFFG